LDAIEKPNLPWALSNRSTHAKYSQATISARHVQLPLIKASPAMALKNHHILFLQVTIRQRACVLHL
jgi:hypothetical protein